MIKICENTLCLNTDCLHKYPHEENYSCVDLCGDHLDHIEFKCRICSPVEEVMLRIKGVGNVLSTEDYVLSTEDYKESGSYCVALNTGTRLVQTS